MAFKITRTISILRIGLNRKPAELLEDVRYCGLEGGVMIRSTEFWTSRNLGGRQKNK